jgi:hypothetical protein
MQTSMSRLGIGFGYEICSGRMGEHLLLNLGEEICSCLGSLAGKISHGGMEGLGYTSEKGRQVLSHFLSSPPK